MPAELLWLWTPKFARCYGASDPALPPAVTLLRPALDCPGSILQALQEGVDGQGLREAAVFDVARFPGEQAWAYVRDGINKSGQNPLRGLGRELPQPFIDVGRLYHRPPGSLGVDVVSLGDRYPEPQVKGITCSHMHTVALLAHAAGLRVTGVVVAEDQVDRADLADLGCSVQRA